MIDNLLSDKQQDAIVDIVKKQCSLFKSFSNQSESIFYKPYTSMRQKYSITSAVISGFAPGRFQIEGISSVDLNYGLNDKLVQPELKCKNGIFHIYSNGSDLKGKTVRERCKEFNRDLSAFPLFS